MKPQSRLRLAVAILILFVATSLFFWVSSTASHHGDTSSKDPVDSARTNSETPENGIALPHGGSPGSTATAIPADASVAQVSPGLPDDSAPQPQPPIPVGNGDSGKPMNSTRAQAANGQSVAEILQGADMSDPEVRAKKVAELKLLSERQQNAVEEKARQLGVPLRIDGPDHKVSKLYDFRGDEPLYRSTLNKNAAISTGANLLAPAPYGLDGTGLRVGVWDGDPILGTHQELTGRVTRKDTAASVAAGDHATHVAGTIGATGVDANAKGMSPKINIDSYEWTDDYAEMLAAGAATAGDSARLPLSNHSYGFGAVTADMGRYETEANSLDGVATTLPYYLIFWAAGNEQDTLTAKGGYQSITFDGLAKNIMTIGAADDAVSGGVRSFTPPPAAAFPAIAYFSSLGPCDDGRIKPDIVANGVNLYSSVATSNTAYDGTYSGTSMATPNAMGSTALLVQLYAREFSGQRMRASMLKALLIETADDIGNAGPDYKYGWGLMNVKKAADLILAHKSSLAVPKMIEGTITSANKTFTHTFTWDGVSPIRATLCWTDPAGTVQTAADSRTPNLKNNLDAKITAPDSTTIYQPYVMPFVGTWTQASMSLPATTGKNNVDNVEQVYLAAPTQAGTYTVTVSLDGTLTNSSQAYSLVISGGTGVASNPPPQVALTAPLTGAAYLPGAPVTLSATATDMALGRGPGSVSQVEFFNGTTSLGVFTTVPYTLDWTPPASGTYTLTAKATDSESAVATSTAATITVLTGDGTPVISSFSPSSGAGGSLVILTGSNYTGVTSVKFNGVNAVFTVDSAGQITATVPALATTGTITVVNNYGTGTSSTPFTVTQAPVLISQVYGAGGNSGATYKQDYIELYNRSASPVSLAGWSVQYASSAGTTWGATPLTGTIAPGKYYLIGLATGTTGLALPTPDATGSANMSATKGKVALMNSATVLTGSSPLGNTGLQDFVGFGTANAFEGVVAPAPSTTTAIFRAGSGATDSNNNAADFSAAAPNPRNSLSGPAVTPVITSAGAATSTVGSAFSYQITASNNPTSYAATGLPAGLVVNTTTGAITGTPTTAGSSTAVISAINSAGTGTANLAFTISSSGGGGTTNILNENFALLTTGSNTTTGGPSSTVWPGNTNFPTVASGYPAGGMIKLGTDTLPGSITSKILDLSPNGGSFFVSFKVKGWSTVEGDIKVTVTGLPPQIVSYTSLIASTTLETKILTFAGGTANSTIKFETTAKRAFLDDVLVYYASTPATPVITATGPLAAVTTIYGSPSASPTSFTVSGANMTAGILVTPPGGFEVSLAAGSGYVSSITVPGTGTITSTTVYLRLSAATTAGFYSGDVTCTSSGASPVTLPTTSSEVRLKLLTITANNRTKAMGTTLTLGAGQTAFTSSGLVGSETIGAVTITASGGTAAGDPPAIYSLTPSLAIGGTFNANNYDFNYVDGTLTVVSSPTYAGWLNDYPVGPLTGVNDDPDGDGLPNGIENILGSAPNTASTGLTLVSSTGSTLVFQHTLSNTPASDLTATYEWSTNLTTWQASSATAAGVTVTIANMTLIDNTAPANDMIQVTATVTGGTTNNLFVRLKASQP
ncbi:MAG: S8 family serine peptidase [Luteolibacter sp.]